MSEALKVRLQRSFELTADLIDHLDEPALLLDLPGLPSNRIAAQLWCVVGARESYVAAIRAGGWQGFACSLTESRSKEAVADALTRTAGDLASVSFEPFTDAQSDLAFALLEHEVQHHGQLIRYVYANGLTFPKSWNERYTV